MLGTGREEINTWMRATLQQAEERKKQPSRKGRTRNYSFEVLQLTTPCGRMAAMHAGGDPERKSISERSSRTDQGSAKSAVFLLCIKL